MKIKTYIRQIIFTLILFLDFQSLTAATMPVEKPENMKLDLIQLPE